MEENKESNKQLVKKEENPAIEKRQTDFFSTFMFGQRPVQETKEEKADSKLDDFNYLQLMEQIDDVMSSLKELKPLLNELSPLVNFVKKKIK
ncbi:hypothetical protein [Bacillus sp. FJAT-47783]|uniref:hypothetical protein n=1 Tax=Bacillus sp. FJAT-47783 TaxID=2922712 RepID=UPI001FABD467|nr:hypothetical protein [Bacillus sp. FJAT-47783]